MVTVRCSLISDGYEGCVLDFEKTFWERMLGKMVDRIGGMYERAGIVADGLF